MVDDKFSIRRRRVCSVLFALLSAGCLPTTSAQCPGNLRNKNIIPVAEIRQLDDEIANVRMQRGPFHLPSLKQCQLLEKMNKILAGDEDGSFRITGDGLLHLNTTLNSTKRSLYTLHLSLLEKWRVGEDETFLTINQSACVEICVCPGASNNCVPASSPTSVALSSGYDASTSITTSTLGGSVIVTTREYLTSSSMESGVKTVPITYNTMTERTTVIDRHLNSVRPAVSDVEEQLRLVIILGAMVLAVAVLIILLMALQLYKKSRKHWCMKVRSAPVSPHDIEVSTNHDFSEPLPDNELFYYYYTDVDSQVETPGFVSSNRRDRYHVDTKEVSHGECHRDVYDASQLRRLRFVAQRDLSVETAKWVDEQRQITERRTSMPTALDDVSVDSRDDGGDSLPEFSFRSLPSHLLMNITGDNNIILTNPLAKVVSPQAHCSSRPTESPVSSLASWAVRHGSDYGSPESQLPPVEQSS
ncbi:uncharacterized protein LOC134197004 [Corticium candelabrum]|uniref:uncharacterized protein LOC134197004 n=1 Tax=Corticium candelabrum TaxID=121492 RepID=UPI002E271618|nr:uncharacterized protein LOC134197004 [Corticium candelabrum]